MRFCTPVLLGVSQLAAGQSNPTQVPVALTRNAVVNGAPVTAGTQPANPQAAGQQTAVSKQAASIEAMLASVDKQRTAVKVQAGDAGALSSDAFFSIPWTTAAAIPVPAVVPTCIAIPDTELKPLIEESAKAQDLKPELIRAVIRRESDSYPCVVSDKGAVGLMQLMPDVAQQFGADPLDPKQNVQAGSRYLKQLMSRYKGDLKLALAAYNAGPQAVDAKNQVPDIPETVSYVEAILKDLKETEPAKP